MKAMAAETRILSWLMAISGIGNDGISRMKYNQRSNEESCGAQRISISLAALWRNQLIIK
jgi:hypothetical protein